MWLVWWSYVGKMAVVGLCFFHKWGESGFVLWRLSWDAVVFRLSWYSFGFLSWYVRESLVLVGP